MDQLVIAPARESSALMLNTRELTYGLLLLSQGALAETAIVISNSSVRHSIAAGEYGTRRTGAEEAQSAIRVKFGAKDLVEATLEQLEATKG